MTELDRHWQGHCHKIKFPIWATCGKPLEYVKLLINIPNCGIHKIHTFPTGPHCVSPLKETATQLLNHWPMPHTSPNTFGEHKIIWKTFNYNHILNFSIMLLNEVSMNYRT